MTMTYLTREQFSTLATRDGGRCVSIFMPAHRAGEEVLNKKDRIHLKNLMKQIHLDLEERGFDQRSIDTFMNPLVELSKDEEFWHHQSEGLAIFLSTELCETFHLPFAVEPFYHISYEFYLKPMIPLMMGDGRFFLLTLSLEDLHLYEGNREALRNVTMPEPLPKRLEEVVGFDLEETSAGFHGQRAGGHGQTIHHGQGEGKDDHKGEILEYFREVDRRIMEVLHEEKAPLMLAGMDHLMALYRQVNRYPHLYEEGLSGNPQYTPRPELHKKAWDILAFHFDQGRRHKAELMNQWAYTDRSSMAVEDIVTAALHGRVDTLFLDKDAMIWGVYDPKDLSLRTQEEQNLSNVEMCNKVAIEVLLHGGEVYLSDKEALPQPVSVMNALYRY